MSQACSRNLLTQDFEHRLCGFEGDEAFLDEEVDPFAARVLGYDSTFGGDTPPTHPAYGDPDAALGPPDYDERRPGTAVSLGNGGLLELEFAAHPLTNSGDAQPDLRVYEVGPFGENFRVELRVVQGAEDMPGGVGADGFVHVGGLTGVDELDLDAALPGFPECALEFNAVRLVDDAGMGGFNGEATGADIDAVELLALGAPRE